MSRAGWRAVPRKRPARRPAPPAHRCRCARRLWKAFFTRRSSPEWKTQDRHPAARAQAAGQIGQEAVEHAKLVVDRNTQCLEGALQRLGGGQRAFGLRHAPGQRGLHRGAHQVCQGGGGLQVLALQRRRQRNREGFVGVVGQQVAQGCAGDRLQQLRRGGSVAGVQPQVQRAFGLEAEAARGVVDLHRRHAQVGQDEIEATTRLGQQAGDARKVDPVQDQHRRIETQVAQPRRGAGEFDRIHVGAEQPPARRQQAQQRPGMAAITQRGVQPGVAGLGPQDRQDLLHADRPVHAGRCLAARQHLVDGGCVGGRVELLVFLGEAARMGAGVPGPSAVGRGGLGHAPLSAPADRPAVFQPMAR
jgi:hypothetical protein